MSKEADNSAENTEWNSDDSSVSDIDKDEIIDSIINSPINTKPYCEVIVNLKIIAKLKVGEKICMTQDRSIGIDNGYLSSVKRMSNGDNRKCSVKLIEEKIDEAINYSSSILSKNACTDALEIVASHFELLRDGLNNQIKTYENDVVVTAQLELIAERAEARAKHLRKYLAAKRN
jgi:hypothetical protein